MKHLIIKGAIAILFLCNGSIIYGQETVFNGLKSDIKRADRYYKEDHFQSALGLYLSAEKKNKKDSLLELKIGKTYYELKQYENAAIWYGKHLMHANNMPDDDLYHYAEVLRSSNQYEEAIKYYKVYQALQPTDTKVIEKIWRLKNIQFLMEDSILYTIKKIDLKTGGPEYSSTFYKDGLVFTANKKSLGGISKVDGLNNAPFKTLYFTSLKIDSLNPKSGYQFSASQEFSTNLNSKFNVGSLTFYPNGDELIYSKNGKYNRNIGSPLQLYAAKIIDGKWSESEILPFNSTVYSISYPTLNKEGTTLYFVSDMPGGFGGKDLYVSYYIDNKWSTPENLGEEINTKGEETSPYIYNGTFYFASNGRGGFGGLDMYKIESMNLSSREILNLGYPINTSFDDFGIALNNDGTRGFISSNRDGAGFEYHLYEIEVDLVTYPLTIKGNIKYKELNWKESGRFEILPNAELYLLDVHKEVQVGESKTDSLGNFEIEIPYASQYSIKIISPTMNETTVSLKISKNKKAGEIHTIVIVKDGSGLNKVSDESNE